MHARRNALALAVGLMLSSGAGRAQSSPLPHGTVRTDTIWSQALGIAKQLRVYLPPGYSDSTNRTRRYPMAVYLHGLWGSERDWTVNGRLADTLDSLIAGGMPPLIVAMPDGDDGWWSTWHVLNDVAACRRTPRNENADTYCVPWPKYDDYVAVDVVQSMDTRYRTIGTAASRGIAGLSMGGYGAISIAARYPLRFAAAASHSCVLRPALSVDSTRQQDGQPVLRDAVTREDLRRSAGALWPSMAPAFGDDSAAVLSRDPARLIAQLQQRGGPIPALFADVGVDDYLLLQSRSFRDAMRALGVPLVYAEWPGRHDWAYWRTHLPASVQFLMAHLATAP
jgi:putative tributyrin esterase